MHFGTKSYLKNTRNHTVNTLLIFKLKNLKKQYLFQFQEHNKGYCCKDINFVSLWIIIFSLTAHNFVTHKNKGVSMLL
jgi:hypothetical protein